MSVVFSKSGIAKIVTIVLSAIIVLVGIAVAYAVISQMPSPPPNPRPSLDRDTDGGGVSDFNELYTYPSMNPYDPADDKVFIANLPNVVAQAWNQTVSSLYYGLGPGGYRCSQVLKASIGDPLVQWYANQTKITIDPSTGNGRLSVNGEDLFLGYSGLTEGAGQPSYFLTHGRKGVCFDSALTNLSIFYLQKIFNSQGYHITNVTYLSGKIRDGTGHGWTEVTIDGKTYVVNYNGLFPKEGFYESAGWTIDYSENF